MALEQWLGNIAMYLIILACLFLTFIDFCGNFLLLGTAVVYAFLENFRHFDEGFLLTLFVIFALGEFWEFFMSFFGIKKEHVSWLTVFLIGIGTLVGAVFGTMVLPLFGSLVGGAGGAFLVAYVVEYSRTNNGNDAWSLALTAFKMQFLAMLGKIVAGVVMACLMVSRLFW